MNLRSELDECCIHIESHKISDRKKYCDKLSVLIENDEIISLLNGGKSFCWNQVISSVQECLRKDAEKILEEKKKKTNMKYPSEDLFLQVIKTAVREAPDEINISKLIGYVMGCMKDSRMRKCYNTLFLLVLKEYILLNSKCRAKLTSEDWAELLKFLKKLYEEKVFDTLIIKCLMLLTKWGPTSGLPTCLIREQFDFFTKLCLGISKNTSSNQQEDILDISFNFCRHSAKDNRVSCCKFGEDIIFSLSDIYELNGREAKIKKQLITFFLLQVSIHQPNGVMEGHPCAFAFNWTIWRKCLRTIYCLINKEIRFYFKFHNKNSSFFFTSGDLTVLWKDFSTLYTEVSRQMFASPDVDVTMSVDSTLPGCSQKRQRIEVNLHTYIGNIQNTKSWLWIHIVRSIITAYPEEVCPEDYLNLLRVLSTLQTESNTSNVIVNVYSCLSAMLDIESKIVAGNGQFEVDKLWRVVGESTLRAFGLNQHKEVTEAVLRQLIRKKIIDPEIVVQTYASGVLRINLQSIKTLDTALAHLQFPKLDISEKRKLLECILNNIQNVNDYGHFSHTASARFLVNMTLKEWPNSESNPEMEDTSDLYGDIKDIYLKSALERNICVPLEDKKENFEGRIFILDDNISATFQDQIKNFVENVDSQSVEQLLNIIVLLTNITHYMLDYKIAEETNLRNFFIIKLVDKILNYPSLKQFQFYESRGERETRKLLECISILNKLFSYNGNKVLESTIKDIIPFDLLKTLVQVLNNLQDEQDRISEQSFDLKKAITKVLSRYSCTSGASLNQNQRNMLEVLAMPNYNCLLEDDYQLLLTFLGTLKDSKPGILWDVVLGSILKSVEEMCIARYHSNENAVEILKTLSVLYPHFAKANDEDVKVASANLLQPFYLKRDQYGPEVNLALLDCIRQLIQVDPEGTFCNWSGINISSHLPDFLCSDYQEVRLKSIETLLIFFRVTRSSKRLTDFHKQEEIFSKMYEKSLKVFEVSGEITEERRTDEIISRSASVLHTFSSLILCGGGWMAECLYVLVKLKHLKNLGSVKKMVEVINKSLYDNNENCLEKYLEYILEQWLKEHHSSIEDLPFELFECESKSDFYLKYFDECVPFLIVSDRKDLMAAAGNRGFTEKEIVQKSCAKIFGYGLCSDIENMHKITSTNNILVYYVKLVGEEALITYLADTLHQLILCLLRSLTDEKDIEENFRETVIFSEKKLSVDQLMKCLRFVESFVCSGRDLIKFLMRKQMGMFENILLHLKVDIYQTVTADVKLKYFHHYAVWINFIISGLEGADECQFYFFRDTVYALVHLIEKHTEATEFVAAVVTYLLAFLKKILPEFTETFQHFFVFTVNSVKHFALTLPVISGKCLEVLHFLIVRNACLLMSAIEKLDNFPQHPKFDSVRDVQMRIKYGNRQSSLEEEIRFFLQRKDYFTGQDSLVHLSNILSKEKPQLKILYDKLRSQTRNFSEDCKTSLLHTLVCTLAKMSCSTNENISLAAIKCLGELGPSNLSTLVLKPEKELLDTKCTPFELITGLVLYSLCEYIVSADICVVMAASKILYMVLESEEGRRMADHEQGFRGLKIDKRKLVPFLAKSRSSRASNATVHMDLFTTVRGEKLWCPDNDTSHENWIISLVTAILGTFTNKSFLPNLVPLCKIEFKLCEQLLPLLVNLLLYMNNRDVHQILCQQINDFFSKHWDLTAPRHTARRNITVNKRSVKCMLDVVSFARLQKSCADKIKTRGFRDLEVNYLKVAKAAEFCAAHFSALLYSELWCQSRVQELEIRQVTTEYGAGSTMLDFIFENEEESIGEALQNIMRTAYKAIGDLDALPGCGVQFLMKPCVRVEHYKELGKWDQVTRFYEMQVSSGINSAKADLMESLKRNGLYQLPLLCSQQTEESQYECLWRLSRWEAVGKCFGLSEDSTTPKELDKHKFYCLKALHERNDYSFAKFKRLQGSCIVENLRSISLESTQSIYPILSQLQTLNELEDFAGAVKAKTFVSIIKKWNSQDELVQTNDFHYVEPIIAQRTVMLMDYLKVCPDDALKNYLTEMLLNFTRLAKEERQFHVASKSLGHLQLLANLTDEVKMRIQLMDAEISWSVNNKLIACHILNRLCKNESLNNRLRFAALKLSGQYKSETFSENRMTIISDYFLKSISIMKTVEKSQEDNNAIVDTYDKLAQFADKGYQQVMTYIKSDLFQKKVVNMEKSKLKASKMQKQVRKTKDELIATNIHDRQSDIDANEIEATKQERNQFLKIALKFYFWNLKHSDKNNIHIFRIMALLLENKNNPIVSQTCKEILPSHKYVVMLPQLIPHISDSSNDWYSTKVNEIIEKCATDHPHHTLPLILSLANAHKDRKLSNSRTKTSSNDARVETAKNMIERLKKREEIRSHIERLEQLCQALIELAYYKDDSDQKIFKIPRSQKIKKIQHFDNILVPTEKLAVSEARNYSNIVGVASFGAEYFPVGGINQPKRITCLGTDGKARSQLLKGHDDIRQDAVMQQVFTIMNSLLSANKTTRNLLIRTYKIVPLSMRSGILEWVDNSMPIGDYLVGKDKETTGAHQKYRPKDKSPQSCKLLIKNSASKAAEERLEAFKVVCRNLKPVFHKFFDTSFPHPSIWYERRRAYIHSVATTSMCGYILGIGDRHVSNILIDKTTAEVIHIDFGIAFEQGRVLPTPETVPFRLTRDIVDGMGVSGVEGIFKRSCEKTMEVLRHNAQTIVAILEVLLYDPLYVWTVTSVEANKRQTDEENDLRSLNSESDEEDTSVNVTAERALLRLREKLQGTELGNPTSIEHQVGTLIQQALDPVNLCKLFHGWQAYL